ncbi:MULTISPECIES: hypothetical protein [unclassified Chelatococcus]|uniref:hypothetical protein n=1 Tax=unclassified Chelatococcus TaxID=2638111 RepID=UPI001BCEB4A7|nr:MULTISPECIES: hypothetical protein [unclassified Chelatococcus]MBS7699590.1 hypothetical protein [Chelatococcus sp. YT9]MBX3557210.1 hypothetical protein [Chelatococcus sp.]
MRRDGGHGYHDLLSDLPGELERRILISPGIGWLIIAGRQWFEMHLVMLGVVMLRLARFAMNTTAERTARHALS